MTNYEKLIEEQRVQVDRNMTELSRMLSLREEDFFAIRESLSNLFLESGAISVEIKFHTRDKFSIKSTHVKGENNDHEL